jgi:TonB dependent receptor
MSPARLGRVAALLAVLLPLGSASADTETLYDIDLRPGPLLGCLERLALLANVPIVDASARVAEARCTPARGRHTLAQALDTLLAPAGLAWRRRDDGAIEIINAAPGEQVNLAALEIEDTPLPALAPVTAATPLITALVHDAMAVTQLDQERLATAPLLSLSQIGRYAPNVYASGASLAIRGQERDLDQFSGLSVRLDGIDLGTSLIEGDMVPVDGLASMQLQRGPRSFERGGAATAGALDLYTAGPAETPTLRLGAGIGNEGALRGSVGWSSRFGDGESGIRTVVERRVMANPVKEVFLPEVNTAHRTVDNAYTKINWVPEWLPGFSLEWALLAVSGDDPVLYTAAGEFPFPLPENRESYAREASRTQTRALGSALNLQYGGDDWSVRLSANSTHARQEGLWRGSGFGPSGDLNLERRRGVALSGRYALGNWQLAAGGEVSAISFADQDAIWVAGFRRIGDNRQNLEFRTRSGWLWAQYQLGDDWRFGAGLRQVKEKSQQDYQSIACNVPAEVVPRPGVCAGLDSTLLFQQIGRIDTSTPVPLVVIDWQVAEDQQLSLSHGRGIRSSAGVRPEFIQPAERDDSTQLAWQSFWWDQRVKARLAFFRTLIRERFHYVTNHIGARGRVYGAELEVEARLSPRWQATLGLGRLNARYDYYRYYNEDPTPVLPGAPRYTALFGLRYGAASGWYGTLDAYHTAAAETTLDINPGNRRPPYSLADLRVGYRLEDADFSLAVTNATDTLYLDRVDFRYNDRRQETRYRLGDPRRVELRWQYEWR